MRHLNFLNSKDYKEIAKKINEQWDADFSFADFVIKSAKDKIYIISRDLEKIDYKNYNIEQAGLYIAHINDRNEIRLSIEGSQIIGPKATKNVVEINEEQTKQWLKREDFEI